MVEDQSNYRLVDIYTPDDKIAINLERFLGAVGIDDSLGPNETSFYFHDQSRNDLREKAKKDSIFRGYLESCKLQDPGNNGAYIWPVEQTDQNRPSILDVLQ